MVAGGGASGLNIIPIARELGCSRVLLPSTASALSACGALYSDVIAEFSKSGYAETRSLDREAANKNLAAVERRAERFLTSLSDLAPRATRKEFMVEARYRAQVWELDVPISDRLRHEEDVRALEEAFHAAHQRIFAVHEPGQYLECLVWKARATAVLDKPQVRSRTMVGDGEYEPVAYADGYFPETGVAPVARYDGAALPQGAGIEGPAIIREATTTVVVYPGSEVTVTPLGNYLLEVTGGLMPTGVAAETAAP
jgi:N-methylhydantoinase A